jgi:hypothetical protein
MYAELLSMAWERACELATAIEQAHARAERAGDEMVLIEALERAVLIRTALHRLSRDAKPSKP